MCRGMWSTACAQVAFVRQRRLCSAFGVCESLSSQVAFSHSSFGGMSFGCHTLASTLRLL